MPFLSDDDGSPPRGGESPDTASTSQDDSLTNTDMEIDLEHLEQSKTCAAGCCDHSCGCQCGGCFCQVRTDIQINANQTTYSGQGGTAAPIAYGEISTGANNDGGVAALGVRLASSNTDTMSSLPVDIPLYGFRQDSLVGPPSFASLRERDAHQSYEEHMRLNIRRFGLEVDTDDITDFGNPGEHFNSPRSDCDLIFEFESNELSRVNSHELPPDVLTRNTRSSSHNASVAVGGTGGQFDRASSAMRSQYSLGMSLCFDPLVVVPECRHAG
jgi:hypothetical protein